jgi:hypothetical protein
LNATGVSNFNGQGSASGSVGAYENTSVDGAVGSGNASNMNTTTTNVGLTNTGAGLGAGVTDPSDDSATLSGATGADSTNKVTVNNDNSWTSVNLNLTQVQNTNLQFSKSGRVSADKNTTVGGVTSGSAANTSSTTTNIVVGN